jgi:hypothetical protein
MTFSPAVFWSIVQQCLVEFHGLTRVDAARYVRKAREVTESAPRPEDVYDQCPYRVAARLVNMPGVLTEDDLGRYLEIVSQYT